MAKNNQIQERSYSTVDGKAVAEMRRAEFNAMGTAMATALVLTATIKLVDYLNTADVENMLSKPTVSLVAKPK